MTKSTKPKALWVQIRDRGQPVKAKTIRRIGKSKRQAVRDAEYAKAKRRWWPTVSGCCVVMWEIFRRAVRVTRNPHHIRGRNGPLLCDPRFWMPVSQEGHDWIHANTGEAIRRGWLAGPGEWGTAGKGEV